MRDEFKQEAGDGMCRGNGISSQKHNMHSIEFNGGLRIDKQQIANRFLTPQRH